MLIKLFMRISRISLKNWDYRKKCTVVSTSVLQEHSGFKVPSKLGLDVNKTIWVDSIYYKLYYKYYLYKKCFYNLNYTIQSNVKYQNLVIFSPIQVSVIIIIIIIIIIE